MARLTLSHLGAYAVSINGVHVASIRSRKAQALLAYLAIEAGQAIQRDSLIDLPWPNSSPKESNTNFRQTLSRFQRVINKDIDPPYLMISRQHVAW